jgi:hypothetical protein
MRESSAFWSELVTSAPRPALCLTSCAVLPPALRQRCGEEARKPWTWVALPSRRSSFACWPASLVPPLWASGAAGQPERPATTAEVRAALEHAPPALSAGPFVARLPSWLYVWPLPVLGQSRKSATVARQRPSGLFHCSRNSRGCRRAGGVNIALPIIR